MILETKLHFSTLFAAVGWKAVLEVEHDDEGGGFRWAAMCSEETMTAPAALEEL